MSANTITVAPRQEEKKKGIGKVMLSSRNWIAFSPGAKVYTARIRYHQTPQETTIAEKNGVTEVVFKVPQEGLSYGQSLVVYDGNECLGGGVMEPV